MLNYNVIVDGFVIDTIWTDAVNQSQRDVIRNRIAQELYIPRHYIRLKRTLRGGDAKEMMVEKPI